MATQGSLDIVLNTPIPSQLRAWRPTGLFVHATVGSGTSRRAVWDIVRMDAREGPTASIALTLSRPDAAPIEHGLGTVELLGEIDRPPETPAASKATVAICMATHEPPPQLLRRQLDSLRAQRHSDWICLVSDDASGPRRYSELEAAVAGDPRFVLSRSPRRLGAYENFHRALRMVPPGVGHVALADQDDVWRPDKLETLLAALGDANLVFSDMRVVGEAGVVRASTYWTDRQPNHDNLASLLLGNTVTGAASLFPRHLLDDALPFPPRLGNLYHDHWLALVARSLGKIAYVPEPLYDYVQHDEAVLGHAGANRGVVGGGPLRRALALRGRPGGRLRGEWQRIHFQEYCRMRLQARVLDWRLGSRLGAAERHALRLGLLDDRSAVLAGWLATRQLRRLWRDETLGSEAAMLRALAWRRGAGWVGRPADAPYDLAGLPAGVVDPADAGALPSVTGDGRTMSETP